MWGLVRIGIFSIAFVIGLKVIGPLSSSAGADAFHIPHLNQHTGESLVVACESGDVVLKQVQGRPGAIQLECSQSKITVARNPREHETRYYHLLGM